jgi:hypothetical protein
MRKWVWCGASAAIVSAVAWSCSVVNAPDEPRGGDEGGGGGAGCGETNTLENCGACGTPCAPAHVNDPSCEDDACSYGSCDGAFLDCDDDVGNGCETDGDSDPLHCASCEGSCESAPFENVATLTCTNGSCGWEGCAPGFGDCDAAEANGCEFPVDTLTDCGDCGVPCTPSNVGMATCAGGDCGYDACAVGFQDCNGDTSDGCESEKAIDPMNCGMCNSPCDPPLTCAGGQCSTCAPQTFTVDIPFAQTSGSWSASGCCAQPDYRVGQGPGTFITASFVDPAFGSRGTIGSVQVIAAVEHACNNVPVNAMDFQLNGNSIGAWNSNNGPDCSCGDPVTGNAQFTAPIASYIGGGTNTVTIVHNAMGSCHEAITTVPNAPQGTAFRIIVDVVCN